MANYFEITPSIRKLYKDFKAIFVFKFGPKTKKFTPKWQIPLFEKRVWWNDVQSNSLNIAKPRSGNCYWNWLSTNARLICICFSHLFSLLLTSDQSPCDGNFTISITDRKKTIFYDFPVTFQNLKTWGVT